MKRIFALLTVVMPMIANALTLGIETLEAMGFGPLKGKRVGLITNPTGIDSQCRSTIDILFNAPDVKLVALFAPEHGVRGDHGAGVAVKNITDPVTGLTVYSLHGATKKPMPKMLADIDVLVYDIQDVGCRSYTFISTLGEAMEACAQNDKEFMVLDRPNPLGDRVEGPIVKSGYESFVARYPIPYIYGLTAGELARMINGEGWLKNGIKAQLTVIPMKGWDRNMAFDECYIPWVLPSPNIPTAQTAIMYPATGILGELSVVSIGVGYTLPFRVVAAPWIDATELASNLNSLGLEGVLFRPIHFKPFASLFSGEFIHGVEVHITDQWTASLTLIQFYIMQELARLYPEHKPFENAAQSRLNMFDKVTGDPMVRQLFARRYKVEDLLPLWERDASAFSESKRKYHLYD